jgi:hypothetical protein
MAYAAGRRRARRSTVADEREDRGSDHDPGRDLDAAEQPQRRGTRYRESRMPARQLDHSAPDWWALGLGLRFASALLGAARQVGVGGATLDLRFRRHISYRCIARTARHTKIPGITPA